MKEQTAATVLIHTQKMMIAVIEEQWDDLMEMCAIQDDMLKQIFSMDDRLFSAVEKEDLFEVQRLNEEVLSAAQRQRSDIAKKLRAMQQGKSKATIYQAL